ncbi:MAG: lipid-binding SYLF domain-containing protein [Acidobacteriota bacterium]
MSRTGVACFAVVSVLCLAQLSVRADTKEERERLENCAEVAREVLDIPEGIPQDLLDKAECVIVIPSVKKLALGFGGSYGKGAMVCRSGNNFKGPWGAPAMMRLEGGSFGLQIGGSATDFILLVMNPKGADSLLKSKVKLGGDASVAAGPKGRSAEASTDALMTAEILTYSRSKGLFAGVSLAGSTLRQDSGANEDLYGREISARDIVLEGKVKTPREGVALIKVLEKHSPKNLSD